MKRILTPIAWALALACVGLTAHAQEGVDAASNPDRKIRPNDLLMITITGERDLQTEFLVSSSGEIQFPFLDVVNVRDLSTAELRARLRDLLIKEEYFVNPEVIVSVKQYRTEYVRVLGAVYKPGQLSIMPDQRMDILDVLAMAGGTTPSARNTVEFTRGGRMQTYSLTDLKRETDPARKVWVQPGDLIEVKQSVF
ncbi:MAG: polysaccharide export protein [Verrucomicrobia bacterium]|nr:polysaccharide export protein [Verrucomicrobiota bacterium]